MSVLARRRSLVARVRARRFPKEDAVKRIFSQRFEGPLGEKRLTIRIPEKLRQRIWYSIASFNMSYAESDDTGWNYNTSHVDQVRRRLRERYGEQKLSVWSNDEKRMLHDVTLETFVRIAPGARVFDTVELFSGELPSGDPGSPAAFQRELNEILEQEHFNWRFADGQFFQLDSEFVAMAVLAEADALLRAHGFAGAEDEFTKARGCLASEDYKEAIQNAGKSFESVMKTLLQREHGNASELVRDLVKSGFFSDLPPATIPAIGEQVLMTLPTLRNRLSGHGQGSEVVSVDRSYAALAVHLAGVFNFFLVSKGVKRRPSGN